VRGRIALDGVRARAPGRCVGSARASWRGGRFRLALAGALDLRPGTSPRRARRRGACGWRVGGVGALLSRPQGIFERHGGGDPGKVAAARDPAPLVGRGGVAWVVAERGAFLVAAAVAAGEQQRASVVVPDRRRWRLPHVHRGPERAREVLGSEQYGQLGYGTVNQRGDISTDFMGDSLAAVSLGTGRSVRAAASGGSHSCVILDDGRLKCFGYNVYGQLGQGDTITRGDGPGEMGDSLAAVSLGTGRNATAVACGEVHSCVLLDDGQLKCFGAND
jgi:hypothetical protein